MLNALRSGAKSTPMRLFLFILVGGFAMWGIGDVFRSTSFNDAAIHVGNVEISASEAAVEFDRSRRSFLPQSNNSEAIAQGLLGDVLGRLLRRATYTAEADRLGLAVTREMEKDFLVNEPVFQDATGRFSVLQFQDALSRAGLTEEAYLNYIRYDLDREQLLSPILSGVTYPQNLAELVAAWRLERRRFNYVEIDVNPDAIPDPNTADLAAWYEDNSEVYDSPDLRQVTVAVLSPEIFLDDIAVSDTDLQDAYEASIDQYVIAERRDVMQMIFNDRNESEKALARVKAGESFADVAADMLGLSDFDIDLGNLRYVDLSEELAEGAFTANQGDVVGVIETPLGFHILQIGEITEQRSIPLADVADGLKEDIAREQAIDIVYERINQLEDNLASAASLEEAAGATGADIMVIDAMSREGRDNNNELIEGLATDTQFRQSVWSATIGDVGFIEETSDNVFYILRVDGEKASAKRPLSEVMVRALEDFKTEQAIKVSIEQAESLTTATNLVQVAEEAGLEVQESPVVRRDGVGFDHEAARIVAHRAFDLKINEAGYVETGEAVIALVLTDIEAATEEALTPETMRVQEILANTASNSFEGIIANALAQQFDAQINPQIVQSLLVSSH